MEPPRSSTSVTYEVLNGLKASGADVEVVTERSGHRRIDVVLEVSAAGVETVENCNQILTIRFQLRLCPRDLR